MVSECESARREAAGPQAVLKLLGMAPKSHAVPFPHPIALALQPGPVRRGPQRHAPRRHALRHAAPPDLVYLRQLLRDAETASPSLRPHKQSDHGPRHVRRPPRPHACGFRTHARPVRLSRAKFPRLAWPIVFRALRRARADVAHPRRCQAGAPHHEADAPHVPAMQRSRLACQARGPPSGRFRVSVSTPWHRRCRRH